MQTSTSVTPPLEEKRSQLPFDNPFSLRTRNSPLSLIRQKIRGSVSEHLLFDDRKPKEKQQVEPVKKVEETTAPVRHPKKLLQARSSFLLDETLDSMSESSLKRRSGSVHSFRSSVPILFKSGQDMINERMEEIQETMYQSSNQMQLAFQLNIKRAVLTVEIETQTILTTNHIAQLMLHYYSKSMVGQDVCSLFHPGRSAVLIDNTLTKLRFEYLPSNTIFDGNLMDIVTCTGEEKMVSLWMKTISSSMVVMILEEIENLSDYIELTEDGTIESIPLSFLRLCGSLSAPKNISSLLPSITLDLLESIADYSAEPTLYATTHHESLELMSFPFMLRPKKNTSGFSCKYIIPLHVGGMLEFDSGGILRGGNSTFITTVFGFYLAEVLDLPISDLLTDIFRCLDPHDPSSWAGSYELTAQHFDGGCFMVLTEIRKHEFDIYHAWVSLMDNSVLSEMTLSSPMLAAKADFTTDITLLYEFSSIIGAGAYGQVSVARRRQDDTKVSIKAILRSKLSKEYVDPKTSLPFEILCIQGLDHPNIVKFIEFYVSDDSYFLITEFVPNASDLFQFIDDHPKMDSELAKTLFKQMADAIHHCHSNGIAHRDIKEENFLVCRNENNQFVTKLIDFGSATFVKPDMTFKIFFGTLEFASPEILKGQPYRGFENDVWALGITLYSMIFTENAFFDVDETIEGVLHPPFPVDPDCMDLIQSMLQTDPNNRIPIDQVLSHKWLE